jgi:DNA recombination protein RmuC
MEPLQILAVLLLLAVLGILLYNSFVKKEPQKGDDKSMLLLQQQIQELTRTMDQRLGESSRSIQESMQRQLSESNKIVGDVTEKLTQLGETNKQVISFTEQLRQLQDVLKNPKQRGVLGEYYLETVLQNVLPPGSFKMQYAFENGEIVDAAVFVKDKVIPIDSKFSLENYNRMIEAHEPSEKERMRKDFINDLKLRIQETAKYIRPAEKTTDFAFMFIPSEGIYYDLLANPAALGSEENMIQRAAGKHKVIIVSPTSFLAYLQTVLQGLKALEIEEKAIDIIKNVERLGTHIAKYEDFYQKLGNTLATTVNHYNAGYKELGKIDKDVTRITGSGIEIDQMALERPRSDE